MKMYKKTLKPQEIQFNKIIDVVSDDYAPKPASMFIPSWYREIEATIPRGEQTPDSTITIKKCIPVLDAITAGYIIVSPCDVYITIKDEEPNYHSAIQNIISFHPRKQAYNHPLANKYQYPKWLNPWAIKTPKGYSTYFKPPAHNPNPWFQILEGFVDTDNYSAAVNFPFVLLNPDKEGLIPAGTPIAQVIPIKRETWQSKISSNKDEQNNFSNKLNSQFFDRYKHMFWQRKKYS